MNVQEQTVASLEPSEYKSPSEAMFQLITGYWVSQAVGVTARLGIADWLADGPRTSEALAAAAGAGPQALSRLLRMLASLGVFAMPAPDTFALTPLGETLRSGVPGSVRSMAITETAPGHWLPWGRLLESVKTGRPMPAAVLGCDLFEWYRQNPEELTWFSAAMGDFSALCASELLRVYNFSAVDIVMDVGGADGVLLTTILRAQQRARGILFDLPHVVAAARDAIAAQGLLERCDLVGGDFFETVPEGADVHLLKWILHDWDDVQAVRLLRNCHHALRPGGKLLVLEMVIPPDNRPSFAQLMDCNMLVMLGGRERTQAEYTQLLAAAGFRLERLLPTRSPFSVIEATRIDE